MGGWLPVVLAFFAGALGGILNALTTDNGFVFPKFATISDDARIWRPGALGNLIVGAIAAVVSWALYSPSAVGRATGRRLQGRVDMGWICLGSTGWCWRSPVAERGS
jgi:hypothetical protein